MSTLVACQPLLSTLVAERTVQALVSHWCRELWQQKVWLWGAWHLHKGINQKIKRTIDTKPKTRWRILFPGSKKIFCLKNHKDLTRVYKQSKSCAFQTHSYWLKNTMICIVVLRLSSSSLLDWCCCWWGIGLCMYICSRLFMKKSKIKSSSMRFWKVSC